MEKTLLWDEDQLPPTEPADPPKNPARQGQARSSVQMRLREVSHLPEATQLAGGRSGTRTLACLVSKGPCWKEGKLWNSERSSPPRRGTGLPSRTTKSISLPDGLRTERLGQRLAPGGWAVDQDQREDVVSSPAWRAAPPAGSQVHMENRGNQLPPKGPTSPELGLSAESSHT